MHQPTEHNTQQHLQPPTRWCKTVFCFFFTKMIDSMITLVNIMKETNLLFLPPKMNYGFWKFTTSRRHRFLLSTARHLEINKLKNVKLHSLSLAVIFLASLTSFARRVSRSTLLSSQNQLKSFLSRATLLSSQNSSNWEE